MSSEISFAESSYLSWIWISVTLKDFDTLNYFLKTEMVGRIPETKLNFSEKIEEMEKSVLI